MGLQRCSANANAEADDAAERLAELALKGSVSIHLTNGHLWFFDHEARRYHCARCGGEGVLDLVRNG